MKPLSLLTFLLASCAPTAVCTIGATRCTGAASEVCLADRTWKKVQDCDYVSKNSNVPFVCCDKPRPAGTGATCVPEAVCR